MQEDGVNILQNVDELKEAVGVADRHAVSHSISSHQSNVKSSIFVFHITWVEEQKVLRICYPFILLSSSLLSKNLKIKICRNIILPVVLYGCETWSPTLQEERKLRVWTR